MSASDSTSTQPVIEAIFRAMNLRIADREAAKLPRWADGFLSLRTEPSSAVGRRIATLPNGSSFQVLERRSNGWWLVRTAAGLQGWLLSGSGNKSWVDCCVSPVVNERQTVQKTGVRFPEPGSTDRREMMDAIRIVRGSNDTYNVHFISIVDKGTSSLGVADVDDNVASGGFYMFEKTNNVWHTLYMTGGIGGSGDCETEDNVVKKMLQKSAAYDVPRSFMPKSVWDSLDDPARSNRTPNSGEDCVGSMSQDFTWDSFAGDMYSVDIPPSLSKTDQVPDTWESGDRQSSLEIAVMMGPAVSSHGPDWSVCGSVPPLYHISNPSNPRLWAFSCVGKNDKIIYNMEKFSKLGNASVSFHFEYPFQQTSYWDQNVETMIKSLNMR
jgi:hypothetical protein